MFLFAPIWWDKVTLSKSKSKVSKIITKSDGAWHVKLLSCKKEDSLRLQMWWIRRQETRLLLFGVKRFYKIKLLSNMTWIKGLFVWLVVTWVSIYLFVKKNHKGNYTCHDISANILYKLVSRGSKVAKPLIVLTKWDIFPRRQTNKSAITLSVTANH